MKKMSWGLLCILLLCGCSFGENKASVAVAPKEQMEVSQLEAIADVSSGNESAKTPIMQPKSEEMKSLGDQEGYYYSIMDTSQQAVYEEILYALQNYIEEMPLSTTETQVVDYVFQCVLMDHPEIFYADGYSFAKYSLGDEVKKITFSGTYNYSKEEKEIKEAQIEQVSMDMLKEIPASASDYDKVKYVYEKIIKNTEYDITAQDNQNICSVFLNKASVCQGYAKAVQYLLTKLGVPSTLVAGFVDSGEGHAWNMVKIDGRFYYLDATWGDASYLFHVNDNVEEIQNTPDINYDYLCVTTEEIFRTHTLNSMFSMPLCESTSANYYVREGAYFVDVNDVQLEQLIESYRKQGRESVTLKCADESVYDRMVESLIQEQQIFRFIEGENNSILYTDSPKQLSITFWL